MARLRIPTIASAIFLMSCTQQPHAPAENSAREPIKLAVPGTLNRMPSLASSGDRVVAVWTSTQDDMMDVYSAISGDGGETFSSPRRVNDRPNDVSSNAEQPPRVAISGGSVAVVWPSKLGGVSAMRMARSTDGGWTFGPAITLHDRTLSGARGWHSVTAGRDGGIHVVWLDGRHAGPSAGPHHHHEGAAVTPPPVDRAPRQDVYEAVVRADGAIVETHVARDVCFCCKTAVSVGSSGRVNVVWRHIFPANMRDIAMATSTDGGQTFGSLVRVSEDKWQLSGCPDDGPAMALDARDAAHLVWPTLVNQTSPQKAIFYTSTGDGRSFAPRVRLSSDDREDAAHPQIAVDVAGNVAAAWDEQHQESRRVVIRTSAAGSGRFDGPRVLNNRASAFYPHIVAVNDGFLVAWAEQTGKTSAVVVQHVAAK